MQDFLQIFFRRVEKAVVVKRTAATKMLHRDMDVTSGSGKHFGGGLRCLGEEVVVEGIGPEDHALTTMGSRRILSEPRLKCVWRESRDLSLLGHSSCEFRPGS